LTTVGEEVTYVQRWRMDKWADGQTLHHNNTSFSLIGRMS